MREFVASIAPGTMPPNTLQQVMSNEQLLALPRYDEAFYLYSFKIAPCNNVLSHNWSLCPFVHAKEKARRRDPRLYTYQPLPCPEDRKGTNCPRGDQCLYTHNVYEYWLHPQRFRTQMCQQGSACTRPLCFFAHSLEELRVVDHQNNTVVSAAQLAPGPSVAAAASALPTALAGSNQAAGWAPLQGQRAESALAQQPWSVTAQSLGQQAMTHPLATNSGAQMIYNVLSAMGFQPAAAQRPSMHHPVMQDATIAQQQLPQLNSQQSQSQQIQLQQMQALATAQLQQLQAPPTGVMLQAAGVMQQAAGMMASPSTSNFEQQQVLYQLAASAGLQQPQLPWLQQQQLGLGGGGARPQALQVNPGGQASAAFGGLGMADAAALQAAMQQMGLSGDTN